MHIHQEHTQTEAESAVNRAEHEIEGEDKQLAITRTHRIYQNRSENREELVEPHKHRIEEWEEGHSCKLLGKHVKGQLQKPEDRNDDADDTQDQLRHRQQGVVVLIVQVFRTQLQVVVIQLLAFCAICVQRFLRLLLQTTLLFPSYIALLRSLR